jgi:hypothetical protein
MRTEQFSCDNCGNFRKDANHWFLLSFRPDGHIEDLEVGASVMIAYWDPLVAKSAKVKHACGQACVISLIDEFLSK